jgi:sarcosine oxidase subunit gamma
LKRGLFRPCSMIQTELSRMSNPVKSKSLLGEQSLMAVNILPDIGLLSVRGDLLANFFKNAFQKVFISDFPEIRKFVVCKECTIAWMSPDELLIIMAPMNVKKVQKKLVAALNGIHSSVEDISSSREIFQVKGKNVRDAMGKLSPVNFSINEFKVGSFRRTRLSQVPSALWMTDQDIIKVMCFKSVSEYTLAILNLSCEPEGNVDHYSKN